MTEIKENHDYIQTAAELGIEPEAFDLWLEGSSSSRREFAKCPNAFLSL